MSIVMLAFIKLVTSILLVNHGKKVSTKSAFITVKRPV